MRLPPLLWIVPGILGCTPFPGNPNGYATATGDNAFRIQAETTNCIVPGCSGNDDWDLRAIQADRSSLSAARGTRTVVAAIDTGVDPNQPELKPILLPMVDLVGEDRFQDGSEAIDFRGRDGNGHGTHVCGTIRLVAGTGAVMILPIKAIGNSGTGSDERIARAVRTAVDWRDANGVRVRVINLSVGGQLVSTEIGDAVRYAWSQGVTVCVAAGNRGMGLDYPAILPEALAVGATTMTNELAPYSNRGPELAISAPGGESDAGIWSTWPTYLTVVDRHNGITRSHHGNAMVGTSMATPHVAAAAALLYYQDPNLTPRQVRDRLTAVAADLGPLGPDRYFGAGLLNLAGTLAIADARNG